MAAARPLLLRIARPAEVPCGIALVLICCCCHGQRHTRQAEARAGVQAMPLGGAWAYCNAALAHCAARHLAVLLPSDDVTVAGCDGHRVLDAWPGHGSTSATCECTHTTVHGGGKGASMVDA